MKEGKVGRDATDTKEAGQALWRDTAYPGIDTISLGEALPMSSPKFIVWILWHDTSGIPTRAVKRPIVVPGSRPCGYL